MFTLSFFAIAFISALINNSDAQAKIPTKSTVYWIEYISPRCAINVIYRKLANDFTLTSSYNIPVILIPFDYYFLPGIYFTYSHFGQFVLK